MSHRIDTRNDLLLNTSNWNVTKGNVFVGQCHTFQNPNILQADAVMDGQLFAINPNLTYRVIFHDPKYFLITENPTVFPGIPAVFKVGF